MMKAVIAAGADAVYIGGPKFGARAYADNPDTEALCGAIDYAHLHGVSVHMTVNTLVKEREMDGLCEYLEPFYRCGVDAVLVQDPGVLSVIGQAFPDLAIHASTQMSVTGPAGIRMLEEMGVRRIVFARELSLAEIAEIRSQTDMELEVFAHGALCVCYSGRCLMSSMLGGRSGNRGRCAQPCRLPYDLFLEGKRINPEREHDLLSPKDLCTIDLLPRMIEAGVDSLKIEGRMKKPEYAAGVTAIYRKYLDRLAMGEPHRVREEDRQELWRLFNRDGFTDGYLTGKTSGMMAQKNLKTVRGAREKGKSGTDRGLKNPGNAENTSAALPEPGKLRAEARAVCRAKEALSLTVRCGDISVSVSGDAPEEALRQPVTEERIAQQLGKTGDSEYIFEKIEVETDGKCFLPVSALNRLRRDAVEALRQEMLSPYRRKMPASSVPFPEKEKASGAPKGEAGSAAALAETVSLDGDGMPVLEVLVSSKEQLEAALKEPAVIRIIAEWTAPAKEPSRPASLQEIRVFAEGCRAAGKEAFLALPAVVRTGAECSRKGYRIDAGLLSETASGTGIDGFLARDTEGLALLAGAGLSDRTLADSSLYTLNRAARNVIRKKAVLGDTASFELTVHEMADLDNSRTSLCVYGRIPLMVTAQCPVRNNGMCRRKPGFGRLRDRKGQEFPVKRECAFCYNVICNAVPLSLLTEMKTIRKMRFAALRLLFTDEDAGRVHSLVNAFAKAAEVGAASPEEAASAYTKGHFRNGVE